MRKSIDILWKFGARRSLPEVRRVELPPRPTYPKDPVVLLREREARGYKSAHVKNVASAVRAACETAGVDAEQLTSLFISI